MRRATVRRIAMAAALASSTTGASCVAPRPQPEPPPLLAPSRERPIPLDPSDVSGRVVDAHNARRAQSGLPPLVTNPELEAAAMEHARDMAGRRKMAHKGGDGSSGQPPSFCGVAWAGICESSGKLPRISTVADH